MELKQFIKPLIRYWWLLLAAFLVASASSYYVTSQQPLIYQSRTTLIVGRTVFEVNPNGSDLYLNSQLAAYYADLAQRQPVRESTMSALGLEWLPDYTSRVLSNSQFIEIIVTDTSPPRAQAVADQLANQLILQSPTSPQNQEQGHQRFIQQQLSDLETRIAETKEQIASLESQLGGMNSARQITEAQQEIASLNSLITTYQTNYAALLSNTNQGSNNTLSIVEAASLPTIPIGPNKNMIMLLSGAIALAIAAGAAYLLEYLDDTIKTPEDITKTVNLPTMGIIGRIEGEDYPGKLIALKTPLSPVVESYRNLRMNLQFSSLDRPIRSLMITSPNPGEGKSIILANLGVVMAQSGLKVVIIDSDMRRPTIHKIFNLNNNSGLSNAVLLSSSKVISFLQETSVKNLQILTSGPLPPNPGDLLVSQRFIELIDRLKEDVDIVLFDSPPCLLVADSTILGSQVDGVLLVNNAGQTRRKDVQRAVENLQRVRSNVLGIVLNQQSRVMKEYYLYYQYHENDPDAAKREQTANGISRFIPFRHTVNKSTKKQAEL